MAVAATNGGVDVDLLEEVMYWGTDDFWRYAGFALVAWVRAVSDQRASVSTTCGGRSSNGAAGQELGSRPRQFQGHEPTLQRWPLFHVAAEELSMTELQQQRTPCFASAMAPQPAATYSTVGTALALLPRA